MRRAWEPKLRASGLATVLATLLALSAPVAMRLADVQAGTPSPGTTLSSAGAARQGLHPAAGVRRAATGPAQSAPAAPKPEPHLLVRVPSSGIAAHRSPWASSPVVGTVVASSKYYHVPLVAWVEATNAKGTWGRVQLPYSWPRRDGWIPLAGLARGSTRVSVEVDLSAHRVTVSKGDTVLYRVSGATGAPWSPTPPGRYFVTDRIPFSAGSSLGSFAFGISGIQPRLPAGWTGGNQLAIHGTNDPSSIGRSVSAGCVRVSEWALDRFEPLLRLGTPVVIHG
jgi:lipoprotein-anchoring transpeptidase ErfK/SrfK